MWQVIQELGATETQAAIDRVDQADRQADSDVEDCADCDDW